MLHTGLFGHLPSATGLGSWGIGGSGASITNATPCGLSFQDLAETTFFTV